MAGPYYWVGGSGNTSDATNHWSTSSGGSGNVANIPSATDDVNFDSLSHTAAYTVTVDATFTCRDMTWGNPLTGSPTLAGGSPINIYGNASFASGMGNTWSGQVLFNGSGKTLTSNGFIIPNTVIIAPGASLQLLDSMVFGGNVAWFWNRGTFTANSQTVTFNYFGSYQAIRGDFSGSNAFYDLTIIGSNLKTNKFFIEGSTSTTVSHNLTITGNSVVNRLLICSGASEADTIGTARTITCNGTVTLTNVDLRDITGAGTASWDFSAQTDIGGGTGTNGALAGNSGINFPAAQNCFWVHSNDATSHNWSDLTGSVGTYWMTASGGSTKTRVPLMQDTAVFDASSFPHTGSTVVQDMPRIPGVTWVGVGAGAVTNIPTFTTSTAASVYGGITLHTATTGMVLTASTQAYTFEGRGSYTLTSAGNSWAKAFILNAPSGTITQQDALSSSAALTVTSGTWAGGAYDLTATTGANTGTVSGTGTWDFTSTGAVWTNTGTISFTTGHILKFNNNSVSLKTISLGTSKIYINLLLTPNSGTGEFDIVATTGTTLSQLKDDGSGTHSVKFTKSTTTTVSDWQIGTASSRSGNTNVITLDTVDGAGTFTLHTTGSAPVVADYLSISRCTADATPKWYAGSHSTNVITNTNLIFTQGPAIFAEYHNQGRRR